MNQLTVKPNQTIPTAAEINQFVSIANVLSQCPYYQKIGAAGILAIWLTARELGLPPMLCMNGGMYTFSGAVTLSAQLINMMIVNAGHRADVLYLNHEGCKIRFVRSDREKDQGDTFEYEFSMNDAIRAGYFGQQAANGQILKKGKDNWLNSPRDMFYARCMSGGARKFMPDVLMNCYSIGEIEGDGEIKNSMPDINVKASEISVLNADNQLHTISNTQVQQLEQKPDSPPILTQEYHDFVAKHQLSDTESRKNHYVNQVKIACEKQGKSRSFEEIIQGAMKDENKFVDAYHNWELKQVGKLKEDAK